MINNGSINSVEKIEAERERDANFNVVRIHICVLIVYTEFVVSLRFYRLKNFMNTVILMR